MAKKPAYDVIPSLARIFVSVDEGGDIGSKAEGDWYILCGCSVKDREAFANATRHFGFVKEMKFRKFRKRREEVLRFADPSIDRIFYVAARKNQELFTTSEQKRIHENALRELSDLILSTETARAVDVEIDHNSLIADVDAEDIFENNRFSKGRVKADTVNSSESYEMQTHDFIVGAIGRLYNRFDDSYIELLSAPKFCVLASTDDMKSVNPASRSQQKVREDAGGRIEHCPGRYKYSTESEDEDCDEGGDY